MNLSVFLRSFFFETLWNYEKMQNIGFIFCMYPVLRKLYPDEAERKEAVLRHRDAVNTHPAMSALLVGIVSRLEQDLDGATTMAYRKRIMSALAAHGDRLMWNHVKPLAAVSGVLVGLAFFGSLLASAVFLGIYNAPNMVMRAGGFGLGWKRGLEALTLLRAPRFEQINRLIRRAVYLLLGMVAALAVLSTGQSGTGVLRQTILGGSAALLGLGGWMLIRRKVPFTLAVYMVALTGLAIFCLIFTGI